MSLGPILAARYTERRAAAGITLGLILAARYAEKMGSPFPPPPPCGRSGEPPYPHRHPRAGGDPGL